MLGVVNWMMASADARLVSCVQGCTWRCCPGREFSTSKSTAFRLGAIAPQVLSSSETSTIPNETTAMYQTTSHPCGFSVAMLSQVLVHNSEKIL